MGILNLIIALLIMLRVVTWNMRGAMYGTQYFQTILNKSDVCLITEHWLNESNISFLKTFDKDFHLAAYSTNHTNMSSARPRGAGGTAILIRKTLGFKITDLCLHNERMCGVKLSSDNYQDMCMLCILLPSTNFSLDVYFRYLDELTTFYDRLCEECVTIIGGDCNVDITNVSCESCSKTVSFSTFLRERNLCSAPLLQGRKGPAYTYRSKDCSQKTLLDYICFPEFMSNNISLIRIESECPYEISDHYPVCVTFNLDLLSSMSDGYKFQKITLKWSKADEFEVKMYQTEIDKLMNFNEFSDNASEDDVEQFTLFLTNAMHMAANSTIPYGKFRPYLKPYWKDHNLKEFHDQQRKSRRKWIENGKPRGDTQTSYVDYKDKKREFRKRKRAAEKEWQESKYEEIKQAAELDIGEFYRKVRRMRKTGPTTTKLSYNGYEASTDDSVCELWGKYFTDLYAEQSDDSFSEEFYHEINSKVERCLESYKNFSVSGIENDITRDEIRYHMSTLKCGKAPGNDYITNEHLLNGGEQILKQLCKLFNLIIKTEYLPTTFRHGIIIPLYKGNNKDKTVPNSYRAVTLTSAIGKLFEKLLLCRIEKTLEQNSKTVPNRLQFGFVKGHGSIPAIYTLKEAINYYLERNSTVYSAFLDNEKAFDRIWQDGLMYKLWNTGITGKIWKIIYISYKSATAHVQYNSRISNVFRIQRGVGQGRVMSAWLFALFINDLISHLIETKCGLIVGSLHIPSILLADDTTLISTTKNGLQVLLDVVHAYAVKWRLKYNASKSNCLIFKPKRSRKDNMNYDFKLGIDNVPTKSQVKYAGTLIDVSMKTTERTENACAKLKRNLHSLYTIGLNRSGMSTLTNTTIWKRVILPTAMYSCETWGKLTATELEMLEQTQRYFARFVQGFDKRSPTDACISNIGLWSLTGLIDKFKLLLFGRLCRSKHDTIHKQMFHIRLGQLINGDINESSLTYDFIKTLDKYDMLSFLECYMEDTFIPDKRLWSKITNQSIEIQEETKWKSSVENRPELVRYYQIHNKLTEHRLLRIAVFNSRLNEKLLIVLKLGSMAIKQGQCTMCEQYECDLLKHLMLNCTNMLEIRNKMFYAIVDVLPVQESVQFFMQDEDDVMISILGGITPYIETIESDTWKDLMYCLADHIYDMYLSFKDVLFSHIFNFGH